VAIDLQRGRLDARLFAVVQFDDLYLVALLFGPAGVHAHQHRRPVLALGAACAGVNFKEAVVAVGLAGQQRLDFQLGDFGTEPFQLVFRVLHDRRIVFHLAHFDQLDGIRYGLLQPLDGGNAAFQVLPLAHDRLRLFRIVPQVRIFGAGVQLVQVSQCLIPVKDASSAVQWTASFRRPAARFQRAWAKSLRFANE
jgi:hypothetical protein